MPENNNTEFKREYTADIKKETVAFAILVGVIYVGRGNDGKNSLDYWQLIFRNPYYFII